MFELDDLMARLAKLPGLGPRSARRVALHLLKKRDQLLKPLIESLTSAYTGVKVCHICFNLDNHDPCHICTDPKRVPQTLCIVGDVGDLWALERTACFKGHYHVLGGLLSAVDGMGPEKLRLPELIQRLNRQEQAEGPVYQEVVFAFNATIDAQTTMHYVIGQLKHLPLTFTTLAKGMPLGGELDYLDDATLSIAIESRLSV